MKERVIVMTILVYENLDLLYDDVKDHLIDQIKRHQTFNLGLATGSTSEPLYERLIDAHDTHKVDFSHVSTFNLDEYVGLEASHHASYVYFMQEKLFKHISFKTSHMPSGLGNLVENVNFYNQLLSKNPIDLQILGIGSNGHIAFNEPGTPVDSLTHIVNLTDQTIFDNSRFFESVDHVPAKAITMGLANIMAAKKIILIATGKNKAQAIYKMVKEAQTTNMPASVLTTYENITVYLDQEAASLLD